MKILIVDDQPVNRLLLREIVVSDGHEVTEASNGVEALAAVENDKPDIVLLDIMMPEMDGLEACRRLRESHSMSALPILFITARAADEHLVEGFQQGGNDYITKPINAVVTRARIRAHVALLQATRAAASAREQALTAKRLKTVGVFSAGVAHSINSLATTVLARAEGLRSDAVKRDDFGSEKSATLISHSARRAIELAESLLAIVDPDRQDICVNVSDLVRATEPLVQSSTASIINYQLEIDRDIPSIAISSLGLSQILLELLENAVESIGELGSIALQVHQRLSNDGLRRQTVVFTVRDSGRGLSPGMLDAVRRYASIPTDGEVAETLGLGLRGIIERVHEAEGEFRIVSSDGSGTVIEVELPVA